MKIFDYVISNYKQILEIQKIEIEKKILYIELFNKELKSFNSKLELSTNKVQESSQMDHSNFYKLTLLNKKVIHTKIIQDTLIFDKLAKGKLTTESNEILDSHKMPSADNSGQLGPKSSNGC